MDARNEMIARGRARPIAARLAALTLAVSMVLAAPAPATVPVVEVGLNTINSTLTELNTVTQQVQAAVEYGENKMRWLNTLENWRQRLAQYKQIIASPLLPKGVQLKEVEPDWNVYERCGINTRFSLGGVLEAIGLDFGGDLAAQQKNICMTIQLLENQRYNDTVKVVDKTMPDVRSMLMEIQKIRLRFTKEEGALQEVAANSTLSTTFMDAEFKAWDSKMKTYEQQIEALKRQQQLIAERALKGEKTMLGSAVKTAALKAALSANR